MAVDSSICLQWPRFGPYHRARLKATRELFTAHGMTTHALETATSDALYGSMFDATGEGDQFTTVFPGRVHEDLGAAEIRHGVQAALSRLNPEAVAINSYSFPDALAALDWCRRNRRVAILMAESTESDAARTEWREILKRAIVHGYDSALVGGTRQREYAMALGMPVEKIFTGYDVVDNEWFASRVDGIRNDEKPFFLASGRLVPRKNFAALLVAYQLYRRDARDAWPLVILGDGPERARLQAYIDDNKIEGVELAGFVPYEELPDYYARAGCFVHPAVVEPWGLVVNEAMACALPVLVSESAGCATDLVPASTNGFTFHPHDIRRLADLMVQISSGNVDLGAMGRVSRRIIQEWSPATFAGQMLNALEAGKERADRAYPLRTRIVLNALKMAARSVQSFHAIRE